MPSPRILRVLGMTPQMWGALPPDIGPERSKDRQELREKAQRLIDEEDRAAIEAQRRSKGVSEELYKRLDNIEASIRGVSEDVRRRLEALETRMGTMERGYDIQGKQIVEFDKIVHIQGKQIVELDKTVNAIAKDKHK